MDKPIHNHLLKVGIQIEEEKKQLKKWREFEEKAALKDFPKINVKRGIGVSSSETMKERMNIFETERKNEIENLKKEQKKRNQSEMRKHPEISEKSAKMNRSFTELFEWDPKHKEEKQRLIREREKRKKGAV